MFRNWLAHPLTRGMDLDDPHTTALRRRITREKPFLRRLYEDWYALVLEPLPLTSGAVLELGSGGGFLKEILPRAITADILACSGIDVALDGQQLPFADGSLRGIVMTNVLHHLPRPRRFLDEAARCVRREGAIVMIEPWVTVWSRFIYGRLHHEPFAPEAPDWDLPPGGALSGANGALPWILFARDRERFAAEFPQWHIEAIEPLAPLCYLLSGGVSLRSLMPGWSYPLWRRVDRMLVRWTDRAAMFARIILRRTAR